MVASCDTVSEEALASIVDFKDGHYEISYIPPAAGTYEVSIMLDENAFDDDDSYLHVRGSPFTVTFEDSWAESSVSGSAPVAKDKLSVWSVGQRVVVVPEEKGEEEEEEMVDDDDDDDEQPPVSSEPSPASPSASAADGGEEREAEEAPAEAPADAEVEVGEEAMGANPDAGEGGEDANSAAEGDEEAGPPAAEGAEVGEEESGAVEGEESAKEELSREVEDRQQKPQRRPPGRKPPPEQVYVLDMENMAWSSTKEVSDLCLDEEAVYASNLKVGTNLSSSISGPLRPYPYL